MQGKISNGYEYDIDDRVLGDWRLIEAVTKADSQDPSEKLIGITQMVNFLLGEKKPEFLSFIAKANDGFCPTSEVEKCIVEIFNEIKNSKN